MVLLRYSLVALVMVMNTRIAEPKLNSAAQPHPGFVHNVLPNGLTVSVCQLCLTPIASPTPASLRMAERNHCWKSHPNHNSTKPGTLAAA